MRGFEYIVGSFKELVDYANKERMCFRPYCTTCGSIEFRNYCNKVLGYEKILELIRSVDKETFDKYYTLDWMYVATVLEMEFGVLPRDNFLMIELTKLSNKYEESKK